MPESHSFQVASSTVDNLLAPGGVAFRIPTFQRRYAWGVEEVGALMADLFDDESLWNDADREAYFLGSIVLAKSTEADLVLDGQQRLTTVTLLLAVLRALAPAGFADDATIRGLLQTGKIGQPKMPKIRLQAEDAPVYAELLNSPSRAEEQSFKGLPLARAVTKIDTLARQYLEQAELAGLTRDKAIARMLSRVLYGVEFVRITAPSEAVAFRLFETLNDRGLALNAADLVKNKVYARCSKALDEVRELWRQVSEATGEAEIVHFLRYYWIAFEGSVRKDRLYDAIKDRLDDWSSQQVLEFAKRVARSAQMYKYVSAPNGAGKSTPWGSAVTDSLVALQSYRARSCRPALLSCAERGPEELQLIAKTCEVVTVRYSIVGEMNPNQLEKAYGRFCEVLRPGTVTVRDAIATCIEPLLPTDEQFRQRFATVDTGAVGPAWRQILVSLNRAMGTGEVVPEGSDKVHVEHVLPRAPSAQALADYGIPESEIDAWIGRVGNLTLLSGKKNMSLSNKGFSAKQAVYENSELTLNEWVAAQSQWTRVEIEARSRELAELACKVWKMP